MKLKRIAAWLVCACLIVTNLTGCESAPSAGDAASVAGTSATADAQFTNRDLQTSYDEATSTKITLSDGASTVSGSGASVQGDTITISKEGVYVITGVLSNGQIVVDAAKTDKPQLVLDGVQIGNASSAALYIKQADKVVLTLAEGSENSLSTDGAFVTTDENNVDAVIFSKDDLTLNGSGQLALQTQYGNGVTSKDDLVFTGGIYQITTSNHGIEGKDSVRIDDGSFVINSGKDGIHSENADDTSLGYLYIAGGTFNITADSDGMDASGDVTITGGTVELSTGDDGIHASSNTQITGGTINILTSFEGIEGQSIDISGGTINLTATDDGLNAAGGNDQSAMGGRPGQNSFAADENCYIKISGGTLYINAQGDGVDSNGSLTVTGGETYVSGPTNSGNGALDYNGAADISGGIFVASAASGMTQNFGETSTQGAIMVNLASGQSTEVTLADESGEIFFRYTPQKEYSSVVISTPEIKVGGTYTLAVGNETQTIPMASLIYGSGGAVGGGKMGGGQRPEGGTPGERPQPPAVADAAEGTTTGAASQQ